MEPPQASIALDTTCQEAMRAMSESRSRCLPVLESGKLVGLVTIADFARLNGREPGTVFVSGIMTPARDLLTFAPQTMARDAFRRLRDSGYHQVPVTAAGMQLEGFITRETAMNVMPCP